MSYYHLLCSLIIIVTFSVQAAPKIIIGSDERTQISNTLELPYRSIGQIGDFCTGSLVAPNIVLTAAHCTQEIYNPNFIFFLARNGKDMPFGAIDWKMAAIPSCYAQDKRKDCDFAFIFLTEEIDSAFHFNLASRLQADSPIQVTGYPADKVDQMWSSSCTSQINEQLLDYQCDTVGGMSGAPIIQMQNQSPVLVGVHTRGEEGYNSGVILGGAFESVLEQAKEMIESQASHPEITLIANPLLPQNNIPHSSVYLKNNCKESIVARVLYRDISGSFSNKLRVVGRKSSKLVDRVFGDTIYITFQTKSGSFVSYGNEQCGAGAAWPKCFRSYPLDLEQERIEVQLNCPN